MVNNCCTAKKTAKKCKRNDGKSFKLPRKFSKKKCMRKIKGFTMRSSCAPYKFCKSNKNNHKKSKQKKKIVKAKGPVDEIPFILKEKLGIYEPGIIDKILKNVNKSDSETAILEEIKYKELIANYPNNKLPQESRENYEKRMRIVAKLLTNNILNKYKSSKYTNILDESIIKNNTPNKDYTTKILNDFKILNNF